MGSTCVLVCEEGYFLFGVSSMTCKWDGFSTNGYWNNIAPTCQGSINIFLISLYEKKCAVLPLRAIRKISLRNNDLQSLGNSLGPKSKNENLLPL